MSTNAADDVYLNESERAPFSGYLMPVENYRFCAECDIERDVYKDGIRNHPADDTFLSGDTIAKFLTGVLVGAIVARSVR